MNPPTHLTRETLCSITTPEKPESPANAFEWRWPGMAFKEPHPHWMASSHYMDIDPTISWELSAQAFAGEVPAFASAYQNALLAAAPFGDAPFVKTFVTLEKLAIGYGVARGHVGFCQRLAKDGDVTFAFWGDVLDPARWKPVERFGPFLEGQAWYLYSWRLESVGRGEWYMDATHWPAWARPALGEYKRKCIAWFNQMRALREEWPGQPIPSTQRPDPPNVWKHKETWAIPESWPGKDRLVPYRTWARWREGNDNRDHEDAFGPWRYSVEMLSPDVAEAAHEFRGLFPLLRRLVLERAPQER